MTTVLYWMALAAAGWLLCFAIVIREIVKAPTYSHREMKNAFNEGHQKGAASAFHAEYLPGEDIRECDWRASCWGMLIDYTHGRQI